VSGSALSGFSLVTNWLGYTPPPNTWAGILAALGYTPPTNNYSGITGALGFTPAPNNPQTNVVIYISSLTAQTNASGATTNVIPNFSTNNLIYNHP
jgi:hypothetical protein